MALNPAFVGRTYPPAGTHVITAEAIAAFAAALGSSDPLHLDAEAARAAGHPDVVAPPTLPITLTLQAAHGLADDPELGLDWSRVVHGEQRFAYARPLRAGDEVAVTSTIESIRSMAGNDLLMVRGDVATTAGEHVVSCWSLLVARGES